MYDISSKHLKRGDWNGNTNESINESVSQWERNI